MRKALKKNKIVKTFYYVFLKALASAELIIPLHIPIRLHFWLSTGKKLNLKAPKGFNEKIQWLKVYYRDELYVKCADKYMVRDYVKEQGCEDILNDLYGVYEDVESIDVDGFPDKFVIKCTHACGTNIICHDKAQLDWLSEKKKLRKWMSTRYGIATCETHYKYIKPRIIVEKYLEEKSGSSLIDYKVYCFNGNPYCIGVFRNRELGTQDMIKEFYDFNWDKLDIARKATDQFLPKPNVLDKMYEYAKRLSKPFPFVRVDFYIVNDQLVFGELTFTPAGGISTAHSDEADLVLGEMLKLPLPSRSRRWI